MRIWVIYGCFLILSCGSGPEESTINTRTTDTSITSTTPELSTTTADTDLSFAKDEILAEEPLTPLVKRPSGVYRFFLPEGDEQKIRHTIAFSPGTFRLQEEYGEEQDSVVVTEGTWAPSRGYIWLYKEQVVRGRYTWQGDTLQYYSPRLKKTFAMEKLTPVRTRDIWQQKKEEGVVLYAIGTEPFWSVEITGQDTLVLNMPDWQAPLRVRVAAINKNRDSTVYTTTNDSLHVTVYPLYCNDGMSDLLYTKKIKMVYKGQLYNGCGEKLRSGN